MVPAGLGKQDLGGVRMGSEMMERNLHRIYNLTMNMLAFSKEREPRLATTQINSIVGEGVALVQPVADQNGVMLLTDFDEKMPPMPVDADGIQQLVLNLVSNAIEAVDGEGGRVVVRTAFDAGREMILLTVTDNGPGIPAEHVPRIFEAFHSTKGQGGTGLGLAVAKKLVEEHHGQITVKSSRGEGTTFEIRLPGGRHRWTPDSDTQDTIRLS